MKISSAGLEVTGTIKGGSIITGSLTVGNTSITADTLGSGANSGYNWANGSYGSSNSRWDYSLTGGGYGFDFNDASQYNASGGTYFHTQNLWAHQSLTVGGYELQKGEQIGNARKYYAILVG
jgi:hypothetical protein